MKKFVLFLLIFVFCLFCLFAEVVNPDRPSRGDWDFSPQRVWQVEEAGQDLFGEIQNLAVDSSGRLFAADQKHGYIFIFDQQGRYLGRFGKKGEGPGEIREYFGGDQLHVVGDKVFFADRTLVHTFDTDGKYLKSVRYSVTLKPRAFIDENRFISAPPTNDGRPGETSRIMVYDLNSGERTPIASFRPFEKATSTEDDGNRQVTVGIVIGDITPLMLVHFADGRLYYGMNDTYRLNICDLKGQVITSFGIPERKANPVSDRYKEELKGRLGDVPANFLKSIIDGLPPRASFFSAIHVDGKGYIYLFESDPDSRWKKNVDIFNSRGEFLYRGAFESEGGESIELIRLGDGWVFIVKEDEEGTVTLSKYSIKMPG